MYLVFFSFENLYEKILKFNFLFPHDAFLTRFSIR